MAPKERRAYGKNNDITLNQIASLDKLVEEFETGDFGDLWEELPEADFDIRLKRSDYSFALDRVLAADLIKSAQAHGVSAETLLNLWIQEKLLEEKMNSVSITQPAYSAEPVPA